jgi:hypothetical protein
MPRKKIEVAVFGLLLWVCFLTARLPDGSEQEKDKGLSNQLKN